MNGLTHFQQFVQAIWLIRLSRWPRQLYSMNDMARFECGKNFGVKADRNKVSKKYWGFFKTGSEKVYIGVRERKDERE